MPPKPSLRGEQSKHTRAVNVGLDKDVDTANAVELNLFVLVVSPVTHAGHVCPPSVVLLVAYGDVRAH